jgi:RNA polymerase sigma factor (sigma-70 family)
MIQITEIIDGCKKQKPDCQKQLYQQYFGLMLTVCSRYTNKKQDAEEMLNNGFLKIFTNIGQYEGKGNFEGWMRKIMTNTCLDYLKLKQNREYNENIFLPNVENNDVILENLLFEKGNYSNSVLDDDCKVELVNETIKNLPQLTRTVVNLYVFEAYTHKEIGEMLNIAERTSQWHFSIAKKELIEKLTVNKLNKVAGV